MLEASQPDFFNFSRAFSEKFSAIIFVFGDEIRADAWQRMQGINRNNEKKIIIIPKSIIYEIICEIDIVEDFIELINDYKK